MRYFSIDETYGAGHKERASMIGSKSSGRQSCPRSRARPHHRALEGANHQGPWVLAYRPLVMVHCGPIMPRSPMPGGPLLGYSASRSSALRYLALDGTDHASRHGPGSMIRRPVICRPQPRTAPTPTPPPGPGRHLTQHWPAVPRHARQAARRSSPERTAPAIAGCAMPAQVKLASPVDPVYPVRRAGRGPAPITCLIHLPPPAVRCRVQVRQLHILITHHVNLVSRPGRSCGHRVPPPGPELACGAGRHHRARAT